MIAFTIPFKITGAYSLNALSVGVANSKKKKAVEEATCYAMMAAGIKRHYIKNPVEIKIYYDSQLDIDNHGYITKAIIDALKDYLLTDDNKKHVVRLVTEFWSGQKIKVQVTELTTNIPRPSAKRQPYKRGRIKGESN